MHYASSIGQFQNISFAKELDMLYNVYNVNNSHSLIHNTHMHIRKQQQITKEKVSASPLAVKDVLGKRIFG